MSKIKDIVARQILDSRGIPTVEVDILTINNILGRASIPSGSSKGKNESYELRDGNKNLFSGQGVLNSINNIVKIIKPELIGRSVFDQIGIDSIMIDLDGTKNKKILGSNAILPISLAIAKTASKELNIPLYNYIGGIQSHLLPIPLVNIINGGRHSNSSILFQEFMIIPMKPNHFLSSLNIIHQIFYQIKHFLDKNGYSTNLGDEGGFSPNINNVENVLDIIMECIHLSGYEPYEDIGIAIDCAASEFYNNGKYDYSKFEKNKKNDSFKTREEHVQYLTFLVNKYPILSIEDGMDQDDWKGWKMLTNEIGDKIQLVGDDLFVTQINRLKKGIDEKLANSILIKLNQVGTLTETIQTINFAKNNNYKNIISHRSGETEDNFISNLSVAFNINQIKTGCICRSERTSKYNELLRIEEYLGKNFECSKWN